MTTKTYILINWEIIQRSEKAVLVKVNCKDSVWLPKSQIEISGNSVVKVPEWLTAEKKMIIEFQDCFEIMNLEIWKEGQVFTSSLPFCKLQEECSNGGRQVFKLGENSKYFRIGVSRASWESQVNHLIENHAYLSFIHESTLYTCFIEGRSPQETVEHAERNFAFSE